MSSFLNNLLLATSIGFANVLVLLTARWLVNKQHKSSSEKIIVQIILGGIWGGSFAVAFLSTYPWGQCIFLSLLQVSIYTDVWTMLISRYVTLYTIPLAFGLAYFNLLSISLTQSIIGAILGYGLLYIVAQLSKRFMEQEGLGQGDIDLLAMIGAFTGPIACWFTLLLGSVIGSLIGCFYLFIGHSRHNLKLPFGAFLGMGAMSIILLNYLFNFSIIDLYI